MNKTTSSPLLCLFLGVAIAPTPAAAEQARTPLESGLGAGVEAAVRESANDPRDQDAALRDHRG
jgi:hypothetical protein